MSRTRCFNWDMRLYGTAEGWWDPSDTDTVTIATGVSQLQDKSGNNRNAANADTGTQPPATTIEGKSAFELGATQFLPLSSSVPLSSGFLALAIVEYASNVTASTPGSALLYRYTSSNQSEFYFFIGNGTGTLTNERIMFLRYEGSSLGAHGQTTEDILAGSHLLSFYWQGGTNVTYWLDNTTKSLTTNTQGGFNTTARSPSSIDSIGNNFNDPTNPYGKVGEIVIYSVKNTNYSVSFINTLLNHKWGVY